MLRNECNGLRNCVYHTEQVNCQNVPCSSLAILAPASSLVPVVSDCNVLVVSVVVVGAVADGWDASGIPAPCTFYRKRSRLSHNTSEVDILTCSREESDFVPKNPTS